MMTMFFHFIGENNKSCKTLFNYMKIKLFDF